VPSDEQLCSGVGTCENGEQCSCGGVGRSGSICEIEGICRFAPSFTWDISGLITDREVQDTYVREMMIWDGKFASVGLGISASGLTCDHVDLLLSGEPHPVKCYTAASKESLHLEMLALVVNRTKLAWHWIPDASTEDEAVSIAILRLESIMKAYEELNLLFPGMGGYIPWVGVDTTGFVLDKDSDVELPALDNGQLAWSMFAVAAVLHAVGQSALASRYDAHVTLMAESARILFLNPGDGTVWMTGKVIDAKADLGVSNREGSGLLGDPYEGELMLMFLDLISTWPDESEKYKMWEPVKLQQIKVDYTHDGLPNGPISVQRGWRFSSHEMWKYMVLPYLDDPLVRRVVNNGERARTWNSKLKGIPGLMGSCWDSDGVYIDRFGIVSISMGYTEPADDKLHVTPYGAFPTILADRGYGLAWHRAMLGRPHMQCVLGSTESSQAFGSKVADYTSWDTKVTVNLAALGGVGHIMKDAFAQKSWRLDRFNELVDELYQPYFSELNGEDTPFADPPQLSATDNLPTDGHEPDFDSCRRLIPAEKPPLPTTTTSTLVTTTTTTTVTTSTSTTTVTTISATTTVTDTTTSTTSSIVSTSTTTTVTTTTTTVTSTTVSTTVTTRKPATKYDAEMLFNITGDVDVFINNPDEVKILAQRTVADATPPEITLDMINILDISFPDATRRLEDGRRLASHEISKRVKIDYEVVIPAASDAVFYADSIVPSAFKTNLEQQVSEVLGGNIVVGDPAVAITDTLSVVEGRASGSLQLSVALPPSPAMGGDLSFFLTTAAAREAFGRGIAQLANVHMAKVSLDFAEIASGSMSGNVTILYTITVESLVEAESVANRLAAKHPATVSAFMFAALLSSDLEGYKADVFHISAAAEGQSCSGTDRATCAVLTSSGERQVSFLAAMLWFVITLLALPAGS
jgi:hypothetical protein